MRVYGMKSPPDHDKEKPLQPPGRSIHLAEKHRLFLYGDLADLISICRKLLLVSQKGVVERHTGDAPDLVKGQFEGRATAVLNIFP